MRLSRFERRILAAIVAVALVTLGGAVWFGYAAVSEAFAVGVNKDFRDALERGVTLYQDYFTARRAEADRTVDAIANDWRAHAALEAHDRAALARYLDEALDHHPTVAGITVRGAGLELTRTRRERLDETLVRSTDITTTSGGAEWTVIVTIEAEPFQEQARAAERAELHRNLLTSKAEIVRRYVGVYVAFLLSVIVVALAAGIVVARRVTRRVAVLAEATERVGKGDLSVEVPTDGGDEIAELTRAFNVMVRDIRDGRDRIEYLQRMSAWQEFARRLAHEIKNPLTPIQLAMQQVHRTYKGDDERYRRTVEDAAAIVEEEVATLRRLVGEFSEFARLPAVALERGDLGAFVTEALRGVDPIALRPSFAPDAPPPRLAIELPDEALPVFFDAQMLRRVLDNLVRNAVHAVVSAAPEGGGQVIVAARREAGGALLEVRDDGPGVPVELRARVFDPYYTTKEDGTGLGLSIVKKVVLEHGGSIECGEAPEGGAAFRIRLPVVDP